MDAQQHKVELAAALTALARLLPQGFEVRLYHAAQPDAVMVETTWPTGVVTLNRAAEAMH